MIGLARWVTMKIHHLEQVANMRQPARANVGWPTSGASPDVSAK